MKGKMKGMRAGTEPKGTRGDFERGLVKYLALLQLECEHDRHQAAASYEVRRVIQMGRIPRLYIQKTARGPNR
jgi:hypothetical protein